MSKKQTAHTATPWFLSDFDGTTIYARQIDGDFVAEPGIASTNGEPFALIGDIYARRVNAAFIVRACNVHDDLVAALRAVGDELWSKFEKNPLSKETTDKVRAALAKAGAA